MAFMLRPGQFTLKSLLVATAFIAAAAALVQFIRTTTYVEKQFEAGLLVPVLLCGAIGVLRGGRLLSWLGYGLLLDIPLLLIALPFVKLRW